MAQIREHVRWEQIFGVPYTEKVFVAEVMPVRESGAEAHIGDDGRLYLPTIAPPWQRVMTIHRRYKKKSAIYRRRGKAVWEHHCFRRVSSQGSLATAPRENDSPYMLTSGWGGQALVYYVDPKKDGRRMDTIRWEEVFRLHDLSQYANQSGQWTDFLSECERLGPLGWDGPGTGLERWSQGKFLWEPLGWVCSALDTLRGLERLLDFARASDIVGLRKMFGPIQHWPMQGSGSFILAGTDGASPPYQLEWEPVVDLRHNELRTPYDRELVRCAWDTLLVWFGEWMSDRLRPVFSKDLSNPGVQVEIAANTLFNWAVGRFYVSEVMRFNGICERKRCENPIPLTRRRWCSDACQRAGEKAETYQRNAGTVNGAYENALSRLRQYRIKHGLSDQEFEQRKRQFREAKAKAGDVEQFERFAEQVLPRVRNGRKKGENQ